MDARDVALEALNACERQGGWSDGALKKLLAQAGLDHRDAALATQLCFGVLQNRTLLDFYLSHYSNIPLKRMETRVVQALRLGAYQMLFLDKIPHSAAVDRSVAMTRAHCHNPRAAGMVNAILRSLQRSVQTLPTIPHKDMTEYLSILFSHPEWIVKEYRLTLGDQGAQAMMQANNGQTPMTAMVNTTRTDQEALIYTLSHEGVQVALHPWLTDCLILRSTGDLEELSAFRDGLFYIQDVASRLAILALNPQRGERVLDVCAAPGGKSFSAAIALRGEGAVISCDLHSHKKKLIQNGADRLGLDCIHPETADGKIHRPQWEGQFHRVLVDAPCSGLGVIRKKPDIRFKDPAPLAELPAVQSAILDNASTYVMAGGTLVYSTCTVLDRENGGVVRDFLNRHPEFTVESFHLPGPIGPVEEGMVTLWPHLHDTDGFFICKLHKRGEVQP